MRLYENSIYIILASYNFIYKTIFQSIFCEHPVISIDVLDDICSFVSGMFFVNIYEHIFGLCYMSCSDHNI